MVLSEEGGTKRRAIGAYKTVRDYCAPFAVTMLFVKSICQTEREGFEPPVRLPAHLISSQAQSATLSSLLLKFFKLPHYIPFGQYISQFFIQIS